MDPRDRDGASAPGVPANSPWAAAPRRATAPATPGRDLAIRTSDRDETLAERDAAIRRSFGSFRQVTVVAARAGGATTATKLLASAFGHIRGAGVVAWETGSPPALASGPSELARSLLRGEQPDRTEFASHLTAHDDGCDILGRGAAPSPPAFAAVRDALAGYYHVMIADTGADVEPEMWRSIVDATDQLIVPMSATDSSTSSSAVRLLDRLEDGGQRRLVREAVTVITAPQGRLEPARRELDASAIGQHFGSRTRVVHVVPFDRVLAAGATPRFAAVSAASRAAWLDVAADVARGL